MDNLGAHKAAGVEEAIERAGASVWWLPPYSPDLNPIEKLWSKITRWLCRVASRRARWTGSGERRATPSAP